MIKNRLLLICFLLCIFTMTACNLEKTYPPASTSEEPIETGVMQNTKTGLDQQIDTDTKTAGEGAAEESVNFEYNPYVMLENRRESITDKHYENYKRVVDAIIAGEDFVKMLKSDVSNLDSGIYASFPLAYLTEDIKYSSSRGGYVISYTYSLSEHLRRVREFEDKVISIMNTCKATNTESYIAKAMSIYRYIASNTTYSNDAYSTSYSVITEGEGICTNYAGALEFLLMQVGIPCIHVTGFTADSNMHAWVAAKLDGNWYFLDPTFENGSDNKGQGLYFFGMTDEECRSNGLTDFSTPLSVWKEGVVPECSDTRFSSLHDCCRWEYDSGRNCIVYWKSDSDEENILDIG